MQPSTVRPPAETKGGGTNVIAHTVHFHPRHQPDDLWCPPSGAPSRDDPPWLVFLHSLGLDRHTWTGQAEVFASQYRVLSYDLRGHGESHALPGPYTVDAHVDDLLMLLDLRHVKKATVVGLSIGGAIAARAAARFPERLDRLVLADTTAWYGPQGRDVWYARAADVERHGLVLVRDLLLERWFTPGFRQAQPATVATFESTLMRNDPAVYAALCRAIGEMDLRQDLPNISAPTLIVVGAEDIATPLAMAEALHQGIADSTLIEIASAAHLPPVEQPHAFNVALSRFIRTR